MSAADSDSDSASEPAHRYFARKSGAELGREEREAERKQTHINEHNWAPKNTTASWLLTVVPRPFGVRGEGGGAELHEGRNQGWPSKMSMGIGLPAVWATVIHHAPLRKPEGR